MDDHTCQECAHFRRHYVKRDGVFWGLTYGHCVYPRMKKRECEVRACAYFVLSAEYAERWAKLPEKEV